MGESNEPTNDGPAGTRGRRGAHADRLRRLDAGPDGGACVVLRGARQPRVVACRDEFAGQYFPKKTSFINIDKQQTLFVENRLNNRPRKTLQFNTPMELFKNKFVALGT